MAVSGWREGEGMRGGKEKGNRAAWGSERRGEDGRNTIDHLALAHSNQLSQFAVPMPIPVHPR